jgi:ABC-type transport system substrate-binding protein
MNLKFLISIVISTKSGIQFVYTIRNGLGFEPIEPIVTDGVWKAVGRLLDFVDR